MDRDESRQSIHEIGLARQVMLASGRAELVTVCSPTLREGNHSRPEFIPEEDGYLRQMGAKNMANSASQRLDSRPRVAFREDNDNWSMFSNPDCSHERPCGLKGGPRIVFKPDSVDAHDTTFESPSGPLGTETPVSEATSPNSAASGPGSLRVACGEVMGSDPSSKFPSVLGPFLLESLSSRKSTAEGPVATESKFLPSLVSPESKSSRALQREYYASRTAEWVLSLPPEANTVPGHPPPLVALQNNNNNNPASSENMDASHQHDSALRGNFIPLSKSFKEPSKESLSSPPGQQKEHRVYLKLSLTDSQMDKLAAVLSPEDENVPLLPLDRLRDLERNADGMSDVKIKNMPPRGRSRSPAKAYQAATTSARRERSRSPVKYNDSETPESQRTIQGFQMSGRSASPRKAQEARFDKTTPMTHGTPTRSGERSVRSPPAPIDTDLARAHARMDALRLGKQPAVVIHNPPERSPSPSRLPTQYNAAEDSASSYYSQDSSAERYPSTISPLRIQKDDGPRHLSILQEYTEKKNSARGSEKGSEKSEKHAIANESSSGPELAYTPLAPFLPQSAPTVRKASKTLIGEGGWLENTSKPDQNGSPSRGGGFLGNLVKKAKEMIEANQDNRAQRKSRESDKSRPASRQLAISLSPREQSLLYCELEFALATALNDYITAQFNAGRLDADRLKKTAEDWQRKGRPRVVGFRYDMETQLDLVRAHVHDFKFYSRVAATTAILGILDTAKTNARVLRIRTYCQPDTVIAKQLLDSQGLFNILGCPEEQQIKLAEIIAFFKAAIERRRLHSLHGHQLQLQQQQYQQHQQHQQSAAPAAGAATSPVRNSRSPRQGGGDDWWGTTAAAANTAATTGQTKAPNNNAQGAGSMDPAGYDSQDE
ncbi:uncharacterized protein P884DRAFT_275410 [Thermothelomyces heterothallicus CBS 202.75]|uniref:uncharacterized protein n=1 Tax=Thermothelomyces heterothallicus CBS 202.75 TaxID=1149848 RepID=UPI003742CBAB